MHSVRSIRTMDPVVVLERIEIFVCHICRKSIPGSENFAEHVVKHLSDPQFVVLERIKTWKCQKCDICFPSVRELRIHKYNHATEVIRHRAKNKSEKYSTYGNIPKPYKCDECDARFVKESTLEEHSIVHEPYPHICECGIGYYKSNDLRFHKILVHKPKKEIKPEPDTEEENNNYEKTELKKNFIELDVVKVEKKIKIAKKRNKKRKANAIMSNGGDSALKNECKKCGKIFTTKKYLESHACGKWVCKICQKELQSKQSLTVHIRTHTGAKPFECERCGNCFSQSVALRTHMKKHDGKREVKCDFCPKLFWDKHAMERHKRKHTLERPFQCPFCVKTFSDPSALARHKRIHTGEKPYVCDICKKAYSDLSALIGHKKRHHGNLKFRCNLCIRQFYTKEDLFKHLKNHDDKKRYECDACGNIYLQRASISAHWITKHGSS